ncbi:MAG: flagellar protein FlaG [Deltaproteobacteria bacterium]|nr:flagellar protein FlaG [Deltaproteobacteria bacterium]
MGIDISIKEIRRSPAQPANESGPAARKTEAATGLFSNPAEAKKDLPPQKIEEVASEVQIQMKRLNTELRFEVDKESKDVIVRIIDPETKQVIRQIPSEELMAIRARMEELIGVLYNSKT